MRTSAPSRAAAVDDNVGLLEGHVWRDDPRLVRRRRGSRNGHEHDDLTAAVSARTGSTGKLRCDDASVRGSPHPPTSSLRHCFPRARTSHRAIGFAPRRSPVPAVIEGGFLAPLMVPGRLSEDAEPVFQGGWTVWVPRKR